MALLVCALGPLEGSVPQVVSLPHLTALMIYLDTDADLWSRTDERKGLLAFSLEQSVIRGRGIAVLETF